MKITLKLFATLAEYLPATATRNAVTLEVAETTTPNQLIARFSLPEREVHLVLVNGVYWASEARDTPLQPADVLAIWPPVAGG